MASARRDGVITEWRPRSPFGYAESDGERVFLHIRNFAVRCKWPEESDRVSFESGLDPEGRPCALKIVLEESGSVLNWRHVVTVVVLLALPAAAAPRMAEWLSPWWIALCAVITSGLAVLNLWLDKRFAITARSRVPEATLHLLELTGGWPGSFVAQRVFRHKISKRGYQVLFWLIVAIYQLLALDLLFDGFFSTGLRNLAHLAWVFA